MRNERTVKTARKNARKQKYNTPFMHEDINLWYYDECLAQDYERMVICHNNINLSDIKYENAIDCTLIYFHKLMMATL